MVPFSSRGLWKIEESLFGILKYPGYKRKIEDLEGDSDSEQQGGRHAMPREWLTQERAQSFILTIETFNFILTKNHSLKYLKWKR